MCNMFKIYVFISVLLEEHKDQNPYKYAMHKFFYSIH